MPSTIVRELTEQNLVTWYLLPLIKLNKFSFGEGNFIESYINREGDVITIHMISTHMLPPDSFKFMEHKNYLGCAENKEDAYMWFFLSSRFRCDFEAFREGRFSEFSPLAKRRIKAYSGLAYNLIDEHGDEVSDNRILALDRSDELRHWWEKELGLEPLSPSLELLPVPKSSNYREYPNAN